MRPGGLSVQRLPPLRMFPPGLLGHLGLVRLLESGLRVSGVSSVYQQKGPPRLQDQRSLRLKSTAPEHQGVIKGHSLPFRAGLSFQKEPYPAPSPLPQPALLKPSLISDFLKNCLGPVRLREMGADLASWQTNVPGRNSEGTALSTRRSYTWGTTPWSLQGGSREQELKALALGTRFPGFKSQLCHVGAV